MLYVWIYHYTKLILSPIVYFKNETPISTHVWCWMQKRAPFTSLYAKKGHHLHQQLITKFNWLVIFLEKLDLTKSFDMVILSYLWSTSKPILDLKGTVSKWKDARFLLILIVDMMPRSGVISLDLKKPHAEWGTCTTFRQCNPLRQYL